MVFLAFEYNPNINPFSCRSLSVSRSRWRRCSPPLTFRQEISVSVTAYIALGSNLGDRRDYLDRALQALQQSLGIRVQRVSSYRETLPLGGPPGQGPYLNGTAELAVDLEAADLLRVLLNLESDLGRIRSVRHGPRTLDLDLLLYGDLVLNDPELTLPHPQMHLRRFVLEPLAEIAPGVVHPMLGKTIQELLSSLPETPEDQGAKLVDPKVHSLPSARMIPAGKELAGLRAMVTGSTSGIGRAIALELARAGADVMVHGRRLDAAEEVAAAIRERGVQSYFLLADLRQADQCRRLVESAWSEWTGLDLWINNAGADTLTGEAGHWSFERKLEELLAVDVTAGMLLARDIGQRMKARGSGVLLTIGWDQADTGMEGDSGQLFAAAKGAIMSFTRSLALSLAPEVRVNCIAPGWIRTSWGENASQRWQQRVERETPLGRWGTPEDVAATACWLASPAASFLTGQVIRVNGGAVG